MNLGWDRQRNEGILRRHAQGRVEPSRWLEDPNLPLSAPSGVSRPLLDLLSRGRLILRRSHTRRSEKFATRNTYLAGAAGSRVCHDAWVM